MMGKWNRRIAWVVLSAGFIVALSAVARRDWWDLGVALIFGMDALRTLLSRAHEDRFDCPECGVGTAADEDGCCAYCGRSVIIVEGGIPEYPPLDESAEEELGAIRTILEGLPVEDRYQRFGVSGLVYARLHPKAATETPAEVQP